MPTLNEVKEQMIVVGSVGEFTNALQQIATIHMMKLRTQVLASRPFVETAAALLSELAALRNTLAAEDLLKLEKKHEETKVASGHTAVIIITSNQGLTGRYNIEIYQKLEKVLIEEKDADFFIIGHKGQELFQTGKFKVHNFPYEVPENFTIADLTRLIGMFDYYTKITLIYSHYVNSATREVLNISVVAPVIEAAPLEKDSKSLGKYTYEPDIDELIEGVSKTLRAALFQQQIMDARLSQYSAQMIGMKTASDNANHLLADLRVDYNKQRRKLIDKKISEVFAGSALW